MKTLSVADEVSEVAEDDYDCSISSIMQSFTAFCEDYFNSRAGVCGGSVASGPFLCIGW